MRAETDRAVRAGEKLTLEAFLARIAPQVEEDLSVQLDRLHGVLDHLLTHLNTEPGLAAQVARLGTTIPLALASAPQNARNQAIAEARHLAADIKQRWIEADEPPLLQEIDDHLASISDVLDRLERPGAEGLRGAAARIDRLGRIGIELDGIEQRILPWALGAAGLFLLGLILFFAPGLFVGMPVLGKSWTVIFCLAALPVIGIGYAFRVMPRSRADAEIDALNRTHFVPHGGLYFPEGDTAAGVITIPSPVKSEGQQAREERRRHRDKIGPLW